MNINLTLLMQAGAFLAFIWFTAKFVWPPLMRAVEARQKQIADGLAAADEGRKSLANAEKRIADLVGEARTKASEIVAQGEKFRQETVEQAKAEAKAEAKVQAKAEAKVQAKVQAKRRGKAEAKEQKPPSVAGSSLPGSCRPARAGRSRCSSPGGSTPAKICATCWRSAPSG